MTNLSLLMDEAVNSAEKTNSSLPEALSEKFEKIFPSWPIMVATLIAFVIVIIVLYFLTHKPINKAIKARQKYIQDNIDSAKRLNDESQVKLNQANQKLSQAHDEATKIVQEAINNGNKKARQEIEQARITSKRMIEEARMDVKKQKEEFFEESKKHIAEVASELSKKILQSSVSKETEDAIIDEFLHEGKIK
ncbi:ATP synthase F0 sector subunit b [Mycoplasmopsis meleagridis]|uniref:ATP synthase subunit b n=1 Tax=Mycoplasmopsis meleagridis ATCC 25294 TaxID=1264554 RepID=A0A0F5H089_9BACT|nr:F0F1 ATP synthase subunit B [Mycoplasmopsis meleagridis]KKB26628.1 ATP synthase F0 sector subunit b [Mycoplasmopsis meleagridis ATCC 25294]OAD18257.1 ATP synthase F0 sector subunit b [Mycoplasmopsis meleagridis]VEU77682.1 ATP synthase subunit b [Mycoplasmopsis meleagridis]